LGSLLFLFAPLRLTAEGHSHQSRALPAAVAEGDRRRVARGHFRMLTRSLFERGVLWWAPRDTVIARVDVQGLEHLRAAQEQGAVILFARISWVWMRAGRAWPANSTWRACIPGRRARS